MSYTIEINVYNKNIWTRQKKSNKNKENYKPVNSFFQILFQTKHKIVTFGTCSK